MDPLIVKSVSSGKSMRVPAFIVCSRGWLIAVRRSDDQVRLVREQQEIVGLLLAGRVAKRCLSREV